MARTILRNKETHNTIFGNIPVYAYGIEADTYEEAYAMAKEMFNQDLTADIERAIQERPFEIEIDW